MYSEYFARYDAYFSPERRTLDNLVFGTHNYFLIPMATVSPLVALVGVYTSLKSPTEFKWAPLFQASVLTLTALFFVIIVSNDVLKTSEGDLWNPINRLRNFWKITLFLPILAAISMRLMPSNLRKHCFIACLLAYLTLVLGDQANPQSILFAFFVLFIVYLYEPNPVTTKRLELNRTKLVHYLKIERWVWHDKPTLKRVLRPTIIFAACFISFTKFIHDPGYSLNVGFAEFNDSRQKLCTIELDTCEYGSIYVTQPSHVTYLSNVFDLHSYGGYESLISPSYVEITSPEFLKENSRTAASYGLRYLISDTSVHNPNYVLIDKRSATSLGLPIYNSVKQRMEYEKTISF